jgi:septum formation protein
MENFNYRLILASGSPRRKELLGHLGIPFDIKVSNVAEVSTARKPEDFVKEIAGLKGDAIFNIYKKEYSHLMVVSADTTVCLNGKIFEKPSSRDEARSFLADLSGKTHSVFTAVSIHFKHSDQEDKLDFIDESKVTFDPISELLMERYLDTGDSLDKAGAYGIQGPSLTFISRVEGSYSNVVGFPLSRFVNEVSLYFKHLYPQVNSWQDLF